jgi:chemotaxis methyl-accepting protein methylase
MIDTDAVESVVDRVAELLRQRIGLRPDPTLRGRLRRAVRDEATVHGYDLDTYASAVATGGHTLQSLLDRVTVQETGFFRHPEHFDVLARDILPTLSPPVTIWSAACANGQEAVSLAIVLEEQGIDGGVIATDISSAALRRTALGRYTRRELSGLSAARIDKYLTRTGDAWEVGKQIRDRISTAYHNLLDPLPPEVRSCQVIFCRNVLIYLSPEHVRALLDRIADTFPPKTPLFLGAAETAWQFSDRFRAVPLDGTFIYRQAPVRKTAPTIPAAQRDPRPSKRAEPSRPVTQVERSDAVEQAVDQATQLAKIGQDAIAAGDYDAAVVAFRKCAYLVPHDPVAQLQLGLALEAAGDERSAQRAYAAARSGLRHADPADRVAGAEGYSPAELVRLLDSKQRRSAQ